MPEKGYFLKMTGAFFLGLASLAVAVIIVFLAAPFILPLLAVALPFLVGAALVVIAVIVVWAIVYALTMLGVGIYYFINHPAEVNKSSKGYEMKGIKESGRRTKKEEEE